MKNFFYLFFLSLISFIVLSFSLKDDPLENFIKIIEDYSNSSTSEKVHLHLDKPYYSIGDDLWFKAYVVNSKKNELSTRSKILYIDIIDDQDSLRKQMVMPLANGICFGNLQLTDSLVDEGRYHIKAYTKWMLNFDQDFLYEKDILIGDANTESPVVADFKFSSNDKQTAIVKFFNLADSTPLVSSSTEYTILSRNREISSGHASTDDHGQVIIGIPNTIKNNDHAILRSSIKTPNGQIAYKLSPIVFPSNEIDLQFFPESGNMIDGIRSKVAFKATGADGLGVDVEGFIEDQNHKRVIDFKTSHAGMGIVALMPNSSDQYTAVVTRPKVLNPQSKLPLTQNEGYVLSLNHLNKDSLSLRVSSSEKLVKNQELVLVALQNGSVKFVSKINNNKPIINGIVPKDRFAAGIVQFTLFSSDFKPLAERLVFINENIDPIALSLNTSKQAYGRREKVDVDLDATYKNGLGMSGSFSVAITNENKVIIDKNEETTIVSDFLLSSDLKGFIENPNYYFDSVNATKIQHLDYLMLSQGWRRFQWNDLLENRTSLIKYPAEEGLSISGFVANLQKKPVPNGKVEIFGNTSEGVMATSAVADEKGFFSLNDLVFSGNATFTAKGSNTKNRNVNVYFDKQLRVKSENHKTQKADFLSGGIFSYLKATKERLDALVKNGVYNRGIVLKEVNIKAPFKETNTVKGSKKLGNSVADIVITKDRLKNYSNVIQAFYGLPGIEVLGSGSTDGTVALVGRSSITGGKIIMKVILDGTEIPPDALKDVPPSIIEGIEILKRGSAAIYNAQGVIVITSKTGADVPYSKYALNSYKMQGYHVSRDFYTPVYDKKEVSENIPDLRSTIFWKPDLITNEQGKTSFSFYTADEPGKYRITIEGLDIEGRLVRKVFFLKR